MTPDQAQELADLDPASVAQSAEHPACIRDVEGSTPSAGLDDLYDDNAIHRVIRQSND